MDGTPILLRQPGAPSSDANTIPGCPAGKAASCLNRSDLNPTGSKAGCLLPKRDWSHQEPDGAEAWGCCQPQAGEA